MSKRFIFIESNSGYVWGEALADDIISAARAMDIEIHGSEADSYQDLGCSPSDSSGYFIAHDGTGSDLVVDDGQDPALIAAVEALPVAGYVRSIHESTSYF